MRVTSPLVYLTSSARIKRSLSDVLELKSSPMFTTKSFWNVILSSYLKSLCKRWAQSSANSFYFSEEYFPKWGEVYQRRNLYSWWRWSDRTSFVCPFLSCFWNASLHRQGHREIFVFSHHFALPKSTNFSGIGVRFILLVNFSLNTCITV